MYKLNPGKKYRSFYETQFKTVTEIVLDYYNAVNVQQTSFEDLESRSRKGLTAKIRHIIFYLYKEKFNVKGKFSGKDRYKETQVISLADIGSFLDRDHSTVLHSSNTVEKWLYKNKPFEYDLKELKDRVNSHCMLTPQTVAPKTHNINYDFTEVKKLVSGDAKIMLNEILAKIKQKKYREFVID